MRGTAGTDSDYDLLVVVPDDVPLALRRSTRAYETLWGLSTSGDILVWNPHRLLRATAPPCVPAVHGRAGGDSALFPLTRYGRRTLASSSLPPRTTRSARHQAAPQPNRRGTGAHSGLVHTGAQWCDMMISMADIERSVRQSVSIPSRIAKRARAMAKTRKTSANRILVDLIEAGLESREAEKERFFSLVSRLTQSKNTAERQRLKEELARMTFGE